MLLHANTITGNTIAFPFFGSLRRCLEIVIYWVKQESRIVIYMTSIDVPLPKICNEIQNAQFVVPNKLKQMWCFTQPIIQFKLMFSQCFMKINFFLLLLQINGMSNRYWGWGREDDELYVRMKKANLNVRKI